MTVGTNAVELFRPSPLDAEGGHLVTLPERTAASATTRSPKIGHAIARVLEFGRFDDLVQVDAQGRAHRNDGKFLSNYELDQIAAHQQLIREGVAHRVSEQAAREARKRKLLGIYGISNYRRRYAGDPEADPDAWARREYSAPPPSPVEEALAWLAPLYADDWWLFANRIPEVQPRLKKVVSMRTQWTAWRERRLHHARENYMERQERRERLRSRLGNAAVALLAVGTAAAIGYYALESDQSPSGQGDPYASVCAHPQNVEEARIWSCTGWLNKYHQRQVAKEHARASQYAAPPAAKSQPIRSISPPYTMRTVVLRPGSGDSLWREERLHHPRASEHSIWLRVRHDMAVNHVPNEAAAEHMWGQAKITR